MAKITNLIGREILDSRGNPTVEATIILDNGLTATASVPSGASTGSREALELRDNDPKRFHGKGVLKAVNNINTIIKDNLVGKELEQVMVKMDMVENSYEYGTPVSVILVNKKYEKTGFHYGLFHSAVFMHFCIRKSGKLFCADE